MSEPLPSSDASTAGPSSDDGPLAVVPVDLRDHVRFSPTAANRVRVLSTPALALDLWCIEPQQATPVLHHPEADVTYTVVGGRSWFATEEGEVGLDPMGALLVPRGVHHGIDNRGTDPLIVLASMSPPDDVPTEAPEDPRYEAIRPPEERSGPLTRALGRLLGGDRGPRTG